MTRRVTIEALADWLKRQDDIALLGHVMPDGDAAGSNLALWHALRAMGKRAVVCLPGGVPLMYASLPGAETVAEPDGALPFAPKAALAVDVSEAARLGEAGLKLFEACEARAALDHHHTNPGFGQLFVLDGDAAAAGELVVDLIDALGVKLTEQMGQCLFVAISTDCGQFSYSNTRPQTFRAAARCAETGIAIDSITEALYRTRTRGRTRLLGLALSELEISPDGQLAWSRVTQDMLRRAGATHEDKEGIVNYLLEMEGVRLAVLAEERGDRETKFSLRSKAPINVARDVASPLGGGGHDRAAGITINLPLEDALARVLALAGETVAKA
ncbi:MAG: DHH family phosphoesterase [Clostridia bacterium]|nr:DHH family phosphoesterase [Clostridia bacterium]